MQGRHGEAGSAGPGLARKGSARHGEAGKVSWFFVFIQRDKFMATAVLANKSKASANKEASSITLKPIRRQIITVRIVGKSPLIQHQWSEKARKMMRDKHAGKKTKDREVRDPQKEGEEAAYRTVDGRYGVPAMAIKSALIEAAHKDLGIEKTLVRKALFLVCHDPGDILPLECEEPVIQENVVRVGQGSADLRYRPYFFNWACEVTWEIDAELLKVSDLLVLLDRAGFGVGLGEWRPEKGGEYGRFEIDKNYPARIVEG